MSKMSAWISKNPKTKPTLTEEELFKLFEDIWSKGPQTRYWTRSYENEFGVIRIWNKPYNPKIKRGPRIKRAHKNKDNE